MRFGLPSGILACAATLALSIAPALAKPPPEAFGDQPPIRAASLSPNGGSVAFISRIRGIDYLTLFDLGTQAMTPVAQISTSHAQAVAYVDANHVIVFASQTKAKFGHMQFGAALAYNIKTKKLVHLLDRTEGIYPQQGGLGSIIAVDPDGQNVYMPAFMNDRGGVPTYDVLKVNLDTGFGKRYSGKIGDLFTVDWFVSPTGQVIAREDFDTDKQTHQVVVYDGLSFKPVFGEKANLGTFSVEGFSASTGNLVINKYSSDGYANYYELPLKGGEPVGPILQKPDTDIEGIITDSNRRMLGVSYSGLKPSYQMFDTKVGADIKAVQDQLSKYAVSLASWSADWSRLLFLVEGGGRAEQYALLDRNTHKLSLLFDARPDLPAENVAGSSVITYAARDGLQITAIVTWPAGVAPETQTKLPLVVLPHGGPVDYDRVGFDWLAQFLANEGYLVLQPNFRGSDGLGAAFRDAGYEEWGRKMQDDVTDGAKALINLGWADSSRMCIVGWSYGGYSALAGGALTPEMYKCVASIAGVSDLREMLADERRTYGRDSRTYVLWSQRIGDPDKDAAAIDAVSPAKHADNFRAPVLLVHGEDDATVPIAQSARMADALKAAGKEATFVRIKDDGHSLDRSNSRQRVLTELSTFLAKYLH